MSFAHDSEANIIKERCTATLPKRLRWRACVSFADEQTPSNVVRDVARFALCSSPQLGSPAPDQEACIANISPRERRKRLLGGIVGFTIGLAILLLMIGIRVNPRWRLGLFVPLFGGAVGFFQKSGSHSCRSFLD